MSRHFIHSRPERHTAASIWKHVDRRLRTQAVKDGVAIDQEFDMAAVSMDHAMAQLHEAYWNRVEVTGELHNW